MNLQELPYTQFVEWRREGLSHIEIAQKVGVNVGKLQRWAYATAEPVKAPAQSTLLLNRRYAELRAKGLSDVSVGLVLGITDTTVNRWKLNNDISKQPTPASVSEQYKVLRGYKIPNATIAKAFKMPVEDLAKWDSPEQALPIKDRLTNITGEMYFSLKLQHKTDAAVASVLKVHISALTQWKRRKGLTRRQVAPPMPTPMPRTTAKLVTQYWPLIAKQHEELQAHATDKLIRCCWIIEWRRSIGAPIEKEEKYVSRTLHFAKGDMHKSRAKIKQEYSLSICQTIC